MLVCKLTALGNANPAAPAARNLSNYHGTEEILPVVNGTFEWGVVIALFSSALSIVPRHCARLTYFLQPKLRKINAMLIAPQLIPLTLRRLRHACVLQGEFP